MLTARVQLHPGQASTRLGHRRQRLQVATKQGNRHRLGDAGGDPCHRGRHRVTDASRWPFPDHRPATSAMFAVRCPEQRPDPPLQHGLPVPSKQHGLLFADALPSGWSRRSSLWRGRQPTGLTANTPLRRPRSGAGAACSLSPPSRLLAAASEGGVHATRGHGRQPAGQHHQAPDRPAGRTGLRADRAADGACRRRGRTTSHEVWSPQTTLACCSRSRTLLVLGAWRPSHPWRSARPGPPQHRERAAHRGLLTGTAF